MWQQIIAIVVVVLAALYAFRSLAPKRWRRRFGLTQPEQDKPAAKSGCGCDTGKDGCH